MRTVFNTKNVPSEERIMFLGPELSLQRYDSPKYPKFLELWRRQEDFRWMPDRYQLSKDRSDYEALDDKERFIFESNLKWQTATDSLLSRSIHQISQYITNPELELCVGIWASMENVHSFSYTWILQNICKNPGKFFDSILEDEEIMKRITFIKKSYDKFFTDGDIKQKILDAVFATQITEGVSFYVSFVCGFYFAYKGKMEGNGKILSEINRDEGSHLAITQQIIKYWRENKEEGFQGILKSNEDKIYSLYEHAVKVEKDWAEYLFSKGSLLGLNPAILGSYIEWLANHRLNSMGYKKIFETKNNPLGAWVEPFFDSSKKQSAPQETAIDTYLIGNGNSAIQETDFEDIKL